MVSPQSYTDRETREKLSIYLRPDHVDKLDELAREYRQHTGEQMLLVAPGKRRRISVLVKNPYSMFFLAVPRVLGRAWHPRLLLTYTGQSLHTGAKQLRARRDRAPDLVVGVDRVGKRRELRQIVQFVDALQAGDKVVSVLPPDDVALCDLAIDVYQTALEARACALSAPSGTARRQLERILMPYLSLTS